MDCLDNRLRNVDCLVTLDHLESFFGKKEKNSECLELGDSEVRCRVMRRLEGRVELMSRYIHPEIPVE